MHCPSKRGLSQPEYTRLLAKDKYMSRACIRHLHIRTEKGGGALPGTTGREILEKAVFKKEGERPESQRTVIRWGKKKKKKEERSGTKQGDTDRQKGVRDPPPKGQVAPAQGCKFSCRQALVRVH